MESGVAQNKEKKSFVPELGLRNSYRFLISGEGVGENLPTTISKYDNYIPSPSRGSYEQFYASYSGVIHILPQIIGNQIQSNFMCFIQLDGIKELHLYVGSTEIYRDKVTCKYSTRVVE